MSVEAPAVVFPFDPELGGEVRHKILPGLEPLAVPVEDLTPLPGNPNKGDVNALRRSLRRFGQRKPLVVNETGAAVVEAGNTTLAAAIEESWTHLAVVRVRESDGEAKAFALADNRTGELRAVDPKLLAAMIAEVEAYDPELLLAASYGPEVVDRDDPYAEWEGMPEYESNNLDSVFHTIIHFRSDEDAEAFFKRIDRPKAKTLWWPESDGHVGLHSRVAYVAVDDDDDADAAES